MHHRQKENRPHRYGHFLGPEVQDPGGTLLYRFLLEWMLRGRIYDCIKMSVVKQNMISWLCCCLMLNVCIPYDQQIYGSMEAKYNACAARFLNEGLDDEAC